MPNNTFKSVQSVKNWPQYSKLSLLPRKNRFFQSFDELKLIYCLILAGFSNKIKKEGQYFVFKVDGTKISQINNADKCHFWNNLLPDLKKSLSNIISLVQSLRFV